MRPIHGFLPLLLSLSMGVFLCSAVSSSPPILNVMLNTSNINSNEELRVLSSGTNSAFVVYLGNGTSSLDVCSGLCVAYNSSGDLCKSFTRFSPSGACLGHIDNSWLPLTVDDTRLAGLVDSGQVGWPCASAMDCSLNGVCGDGGQCLCSPGWSGRQCGTLSLAPVDVQVLGFNPSSDGRNMSSWGGGAWEYEGVWHLFASRLDNHCGIGSYLLNSRVVHATSANLAGPYLEADSILPPFAHEPVVARAPTGEFVMMTVHGPLNGFPECQCVDGTSTGCNGCNNSCHPAQPVLSVAKSPSGPWNSTQVPPPVGPNSTAGHMENPSIWITKDGALYGMGRGGMEAFASNWSDYSTWSRNTPNGKPSFISGSNNCEDPFVYQDPNGNFHALLHLLEGPHFCPGFECQVGCHAFSLDGVSWMFGGVAYTNNVTFTDGSSIFLTRRERPHLVFANYSSLIPVALVNSAVAPGYGDRSFTLVQPLSQ